MMFRRWSAPLLLVSGLLFACDGGGGTEAGKDTAGSAAAKPTSTAGAAMSPRTGAKGGQAKGGLPPGHPPTTGATAEDIPPPDDLKKPPADAQKTKSGLITSVLQAGKGDTKPAKYDKVKVHYTGWQKSDGKMFDSSRKRGQPAQFAVNGVIKGWTEALQLMVAGEKRRLWIPADLAYGNRPQRPGAPTGDLVFDVELLEVTPGPKPPEVPSDLESPPDDATKTESGLVYKRLKKGEGKDHPLPNDRVSVHYSGWTKDGEMFDSSVVRGRPASFGVTQVIKGWTEGLQLMVKGDTFRLWIPAALAYGEKPKSPGRPAGDLVFDVELLDIKSPAGGMSMPSRR
ncbi:MAG: FKBP-type peptidyl-prolyl cis-trans isomerase [Myxococcota bacterium]